MTVPTREDANRRVEQLLSDNQTLHGIVHTGHDDVAAYYIAILEQPHPDHDDGHLLTERYVRLGLVEGGEDTMLTNGITRRTTDPQRIAGSLARVYARAADDGVDGVLNADASPAHTTD